MINFILGALGAGGLGLSARWNWWRKQVSGLPVLMYHKIGNPPKESRLKKLWVSTKDFSAQVDYLLKNNFTPLLFSELADIYRGKMKCPKKPVVITFDDGYKNNYTYAYPILKAKNAKGNIFLVYNTIEKDNVWHDPTTEHRISMLSWDNINEMLKSKVMDMGSHTLNHHSLPKITPKEAEKEIKESKIKLEEKLGREISSFAYPYGAGAFDERIRRFAIEAGYIFDYSIKQGISPWPWEREVGPLKRLFIRGDDNMLDFHLQMTRGKSRF
jgi:peptidoglycan/xylan/chitin deacetylase (PgdA/CDA1 family)